MAGGEITPFGRLLYERRKARGLSQPALAKRSGVSEGHISLLETGGRGQNIGRDVVIKLARGLGDPPAEFLTVAGFPVIASATQDHPTVEAAINDDVALTSEQRDTLIRVYRLFASGRLTR